MRVTATSDCMRCLRRALVWLPALVLAVCAAGCGSTPAPRYHTLDMTPSGQAKSKNAIEVGRIRAAEALAKRDILIKKTPTQVEYYALDQWVADPGDLVTEKLQGEFGHHPDAKNSILVTGEVLGFEQVDSPQGPQVHIKLDLEFRTSQQDRLEEPAFKKVYELSLPSEGEGPDGIVKALSKGMEQLAVEIAADADKL